MSTCGTFGGDLLRRLQLDAPELDCCCCFCYPVLQPAAEQHAEQCSCSCCCQTKLLRLTMQTTQLPFLVVAWRKLVLLSCSSMALRMATVAG